MTTRNLLRASLFGSLVLANGLGSDKTAQAGGFAVAEQSAVAGGSGNASTARSDDPAAAWYNPAALVDGEGMRVGLGMLIASPSISAQAKDGSFSSESQSGISTPPHLHMAYSFDDLAVGLYAGVPFGGGVRWPEDWAGRAEIVSSSLQVFRAAPFVGYRWGDLRIAGGLHFDAARMQIHRGLDFIDAEGEVRLDMDGAGMGIDLAAWYQVNDEWAVGASYKSRSTIELQGDADFETVDAFAMRTRDQQARSELHLPDRALVGGAWQRGPWRVLADLEWTAWSVNQALEVDFEMDETPDAVQQNDWQSTLAVRVGGEHTLRPDVVVRAGAFFDPSPAPSNRLSPSSPDANRLGSTAGASYQIARGLHADAFYELMWLLSRESTSDNTLEARYGGHANIVGLGLRYQD